MFGRSEQAMTIRDYRPKDYVWFDHTDAVNTRKTRPAVVLRVFPERERAVLLYGQTRPWPGAICVTAGPESPFPADTYFAPRNVCVVVFARMQRVQVPPKACKARRFLAFEELAAPTLQALSTEQVLQAPVASPRKLDRPDDA